MIKGQSYLWPQSADDLDWKKWQLIGRKWQ
jgi:hypothetical protein